MRRGCLPITEPIGGAVISLGVSALLLVGTERHLMDLTSMRVHLRLVVDVRGGDLTGVRHEVGTAVCHEVGGVRLHVKVVVHVGRRVVLHVHAVLLLGRQ